MDRGSTPLVSTNFKNRGQKILLKTRIFALFVYFKQKITRKLHESGVLKAQILRYLCFFLFINYQYNLQLYLEHLDKAICMNKEQLAAVVIPFNKEVLENHGALNGALSGANKSDLTELENKVYEAVKINQNLTAKEISENLMIPFRSVQRYLSTLKEKGFIVREGSNKTGYWKIIK